MIEHLATVRDRAITWDKREVVQHGLNSDTIRIDADSEFTICDTLALILFNASNPRPMRYMVDETLTVRIPSALMEQTGALSVCLIGYVGGAVRIVTKQERMPLVVVKSGETGGIDPDDDNPDLWGQLLAAEAARVEAENGRQAAEALRVAAETARVAAETEREKDSAAAVKAANSAAGAASKAAEKAKADTDAAIAKADAAEQARAGAETQRVEAENGRASSEILRIQAENLRVSHENERQNAETARLRAEAARVEAENKRQQDTSTAISNANKATSAANGAAATATSAASTATSAAATAEQKGIAAQEIADNIKAAAERGDFNGAPGDKGDPGTPGRDGTSPTANVQQTAEGATVSITDVNGTTTATIRNGAKGDPGDKGDPGNDGTSPTASVNRTDTGAVITVTDVNGTTTATIYDGVLKAPVPIFNSGTGRYNNDSIKSWLDYSRDGQIYGVTQIKGLAVDCIKTQANAGIAVPTTGVIGTRSIDPYRNMGAFRYIEVNGGVDPDGTPYVTAINGDGRFNRYAENTFVLTPTLYVFETENDTAVQTAVSDTEHVGFKPQPGALLPVDGVRPYMLYAKYGLSFDENGKPRSVSGAKLATRTVSHDSGIDICDTASTGYSLKTAADDWYIKTMFLLKYATKNSKSVFKGCIGYDVTATPTIAEQNVKRVVIEKSKADSILVGSSMMLGTHEGAGSADRVWQQNYDVFDGEIVTRKEAVDGSNVALYFDDAGKTFNVGTTYQIATAPWSTGVCDDVEGDGSPTNCKDNKQPFTLQGIEMGYGAYEVLGNVVISSVGNGWYANVNPDTRNEVKNNVANGALKSGRLIGDTAENWYYGEYSKTVNGLCMQHGIGGSQSQGTCDGSYKHADTVKGTREWLSLCLLWHWGRCGLWCVYGSDGCGLAWWGIGSRLSTTGRSRGEAA